MNRYQLFTILLSLSIISCSNHPSEIIPAASVFDYWRGCQDAEFDGKYLYLATGHSGIRIIDASDPAAPREISRIYGNISHLELRDTLLFAADRNKGFTCYNVGDPKKPMLLREYPGFVGNCVPDSSGEYLYVFGKNDTLDLGLHIYKTTEDPIPQHVKSILKEQWKYSFPILAGNMLISGSENEIGIFDLLNPAEPQLIGYASALPTDGHGSLASWLILKDRAYLVISGDEGSIYLKCKPIFSPATGDTISLPEDFIGKGGADAFNDVLYSSYGEHFSISEAKKKNFVYYQAYRQKNLLKGRILASYEDLAVVWNYGQLCLYDMSNGLSPRLLSKMDKGGEITKLALCDSRLIGSGSNYEDLTLVDVRNFAQPKPTRSLFYGGVYSFYVHENLLYIMGYPSRGAFGDENTRFPWVGMFKVTDDDSLEFITGFDNVSGYSIIRSGKWLFSANYHSFVVYELSDLTVHRIANVNISTQGPKITIVGNIAWVNDFNGGLKIIDIEDPANPIKIADYEPGGTTKPGQGTTDLCGVKGYAFAVGRGTGVEILTVRNGKPAKVSEINIPQRVLAIKTAGDLVYLGCHDIADTTQGALMIYQVRDPLAPKFLAEIKTLGTCYELIVKDGIVFTAEGERVGVYDCRGF